MQCVRGTGVCGSMFYIPSKPTPGNNTPQKTNKAQTNTYTHKHTATHTHTHTHNTNMHTTTKQTVCEPDSPDFVSTVLIFNTRKGVFATERLCVVAVVVVAVDFVEESETWDTCTHVCERMCVQLKVVCCQAASFSGRMYSMEREHKYIHTHTNTHTHSHTHTHTHTNTHTHTPSHTHTHINTHE